MPAFVFTASSAVFSACRRYRYVLRRTWNAALPAVLFIGLNPSTADAQSDDPTIRRCVRFAHRWGYGSLLMANLFAYRATDPAELARVRDPIGPDNNAWLSRLSGQAALTLAAWGARGSLGLRHLDVIKNFPDLYCLGRTKGGHPKHPLYLRAGVVPERLPAAI